MKRNFAGVGLGLGCEICRFARFWVTGHIRTQPLISLGISVQCTSFVDIGLPIFYLNFAPEKGNHPCHELDDDMPALSKFTKDVSPLAQPTIDYSFHPDT